MDAFKFIYIRIPAAKYKKLIVNSGTDTKSWLF